MLGWFTPVKFGDLRAAITTDVKLRPRLLIVQSRPYKYAMGDEVRCHEHEEAFCQIVNEIGSTEVAEAADQPGNYSHVVGGDPDAIVRQPA